MSAREQAEAALAAWDDKPEKGDTSGWSRDDFLFWGDQARDHALRTARPVAEALRALLAETAPCAHEAWEEYGAGRRCADCKEHLGHDTDDYEQPESAIERILDDIGVDVLTPGRDQAVRAILAFGAPVITDAQVEAAAWETFHHIYEWNLGPTATYNFEDLPALAQDHYRRTARAALEAARGVA